MVFENNVTPNVEIITTGFYDFLEYENVGNHAQRGVMQVLALPTFSNYGVGPWVDWRAEYFGSLDDLLDKMEDERLLEKLWDITCALVENKSQLLGPLTLDYMKKKYGDLMEKQYCDCPQCQKKLKSRRKHQREIEKHLVANRLPPG
jgi:hypothetical protein